MSNTGLLDNGNNRNLQNSNRGFFAVDRRAWAKVCEAGINAAVAYLVLASGSSADNRHTTWSVQSIEKNTGISRGRAQEALKRLQQTSLIEILRDSTRPKYRITPAHEIPGCEGCPPHRRDLDELEQILFDRLCAGSHWVSNRGDWEIGRVNPRKIAESLVAKGWVEERSNYHFVPVIDDDQHSFDPDWIWLPNTIVSGADRETAPVELLRQAQDVMLLRLFIDLYHVQNLRDEGGINRKIIWREYDRNEVGHHAQYTIFGFKYKNKWIHWNAATACHARVHLTDKEKEQGLNEASDFFEREKRLVDLGLLEWVPHLVESNDQDAEIIHPYGMNKSHSLEDRIGLTAHRAGEAMLTDGRRAQAAGQKLWLAPVPRHITAVQMIGIGRLRYRPQTRMTGAWSRDQRVKGEEYLRRYEAMIERSQRRLVAR